jgi:hypothetical protein
MSIAVRIFGQAASSETTLESRRRHWWILIGLAVLLVASGMAVWFGLQRTVDIDLRSGDEITRYSVFGVTIREWIADSMLSEYPSVEMPEDAESAYLRIGRWSPREGDAHLAALGTWSSVRGLLNSIELHGVPAEDAIDLIRRTRIAIMRGVRWIQPSSNGDCFWLYSDSAPFAWWPEPLRGEYFDDRTVMVVFARQDSGYDAFLSRMNKSLPSEMDFKADTIEALINVLSREPYVGACVIPGSPDSVRTRDELRRLTKSEIAKLREALGP